MSSCDGMMRTESDGSGLKEAQRRGREGNEYKSLTEVCWKGSRKMSLWLKRNMRSRSVFSSSSFFIRWHITAYLYVYMNNLSKREKLIVQEREEMIVATFPEWKKRVRDPAHKGCSWFQRETWMFHL